MILLYVGTCQKIGEVEVDKGKNVDYLSSIEVGTPHCDVLMVDFWYVFSLNSFVLMLHRKDLSNLFCNLQVLIIDHADVIAMQVTQIIHFFNVCIM